MAIESPRSSLILLDDTQSHLEFDPADVADNPASVAFDIAFEWTMPFQTCSFQDRSRWISVDSLREFESRIMKLVETESGCACLANMSQRPVLEIERNGNTLLIRLSAGDTAGIGSLVFTIQAYSSLIAQIRDRLRNYPKWW
ncbi:MAG: hypothetical protein L0215_00075 [Gemmataceae bacterium]|nr:hypothetical protein [Gemmataceae bacterium]